MAIKSYIVGSLMGIPVVGVALGLSTYILKTPFNIGGAIAILIIAMTLCGIFFGNDLEGSRLSRQMERDSRRDRTQWER